MTAALVLDGLVCLLAVAVALGAVLARTLLAAIVFFIVYGLLVAIAWVRLDAVNVALAEAAIGAGLTGLLLAAAAGRLGDGGADKGDAVTAARRQRLLAGGVGLGLGLGAAALLAATVVEMPAHGAGLIAQVEDNLALTGVTNPVTAVLLAFRAFDTLLESVVILAALVGVWSLTPDALWGGVPGVRQHARPDGALATFGRLLPAAGLLVGIHLLWAGSHAPGGAFQAGTILAAVWLLVAMAGLTDARPVSSLPLRGALVFGPAVFLAIGAAGVPFGSFLGYPPAASGTLILVIEACLTLSIAVTLALVVLGVPRRPS